MIKKTFGNFKGTVDPVSDTVEIRGLEFGWTDTISLERLPSKIKFYDYLIKNQSHCDRSRPVQITQSYEDTKKCLSWAFRILRDG